MSKEELEGLNFELQCIKATPFCSMELIHVTFQKLVRIAELNLKIADALLANGEAQNVDKSILPKVTRTDWNKDHSISVW